MRQINYLHPVFHEVVKRMGPWHYMIGSPYFPEKDMYNSDENYDISETVEVNYDSDGYISTIIGTSKNGDQASFELIQNPAPHTCKGLFKLNGNVQLQITEWIADEIIHIKSEYLANSKYDVEIRVKDVDHKGLYYVENDINQKTLKGDYDVYDMHLPQIALDLATEITNANSDAVVAALEPRIYSILTIEAYKQGVYRIKDWWHRADGVGTILSDYFTVFVSAGYYLISNCLADHETAQHKPVK